jgi:glutamate racemase
MSANNKIGVFDSGIGGATVLKEIIKILPYENYIYYSDSKNNPYGDKTDEEVCKICDNIVKYLIGRGCETIVIACNTASAKAAQFLRDKYKKIIFVAIEPAYKMVYDFAYNDPTLVMATKGTIESEKFNLLYNKYNNYKTYLLPCVGLADIIEEGDNKKIKEYLENNIKCYYGKVKNVVLGCTHYPLIQKEIKDVLGEVKFFNGAQKLAEHLKILMKKNKSINNSNKSLEFIDSQKSKIKEKRFYKILEEFN